MREQLLNDEQRRDGAHGAVELGPPAQTDQGGSPYQTAFDASAGGAGGGGTQPSLVYGRQLSPKLFVPITPDLNAALKDSKDRAQRFQPGAWGVLGAEVK